MTRFLAILLTLMIFLTACTPTNRVVLGPDGRPLPRVYRITNDSRVQFRMLDSINALREAAGHGAVALNAPLNAAAATHSRDMAQQNRPWHFGSDASSPIDRVVRAGYSGILLGENISETYESEIETLAAWMEEEGTRSVILDSEATDMGFSWHQEDNGKIWWTLLLGAPAAPVDLISELQG